MSDPPPGAGDPGIVHVVAPEALDEDALELPAVVVVLLELAPPPLVELLGALLLEPLELAAPALLLDPAALDAAALLPADAAPELAAETETSAGKSFVPVAEPQKPNVVDAAGARAALYESDVAVSVVPDCALAALHNDVIDD